MTGMHLMHRTHLLRRPALALATLAFLALSTAPAAPLGAQDTAAVRPLTLGEAARLAAQQSAQAEGARLRAEQLDARARQRRADLLPSLSALASDGQRTFSTATLGLDISTPTGAPLFDPNGEVLGPVHTIDLRGRVSQSLVDVAAVDRYRSARTTARAGDAEAASVAEQAAAIAASAYLRALRAQAQLDARSADSALAAELLGIARDQLSAGVGVALDVTRAEAQAAGVRAQLIGARNDRDRSRLDLQRALGLPLAAPVELADHLDTLALDSTTLPAEEAAVERALTHRPDLRAADEQFRAAEQQVTAVRAERLPAVGVFADQGAIGRDYGNLKNTYTWGVQLSLPLFDGLRREGRISEQRAVVREVDVRRRDLRQQAAIEVRSALLDLTAAAEQVAAARERLRLAEQELSQSRERFRAGVASNADVITASFALTGSRNLLIDALTQYQGARVGLARAQGSVTELR
jgi:outer membrane protein TolC